MTYETLVEKIQFLGYQVSTKPELGPELVRLQKLRKTYPEYQEEERKTGFLLNLLREA